MYSKKTKSTKSGFAKYFRNADAPWSWCIGGLIGGFVLSDIGFVICNSAGFNEIFKNGAVVVRNPLFWIGLGLNFAFNVVFYLSLTCVVSKINPPVRRHGILMKCLAVLSWIVAYCVYTAFRSVCAELLEGTNHFSIWYLLFLYETCRGLWRWIVGVKQNAHSDYHPERFLSGGLQSVSSNAECVREDPHAGPPSGPNVVPLSSEQNTEVPENMGGVSFSETPSNVRGSAHTRTVEDSASKVDAESKEQKRGSKDVNVGCLLISLVSIGLLIFLVNRENLGWICSTFSVKEGPVEIELENKKSDSDSSLRQQSVESEQLSNGCRYSNEEILKHFKNGTDYSLEQLNAMTKLQYQTYCLIAAIYYYDRPNNNNELVKKFSKRELERSLRRVEIEENLVQKCNSILQKARHTVSLSREYEKAVSYIEDLENGKYTEASIDAFESACNEIDLMYRKCSQKSK